MFGQTSLKINTIFTLITIIITEPQVPSVEDNLNETNVDLLMGNSESDDSDEGEGSAGLDNQNDRPSILIEQVLISTLMLIQLIIMIIQTDLCPPTIEDLMAVNLEEVSCTVTVGEEGSLVTLNDIALHNSGHNNTFYLHPTVSTIINTLYVDIQIFLLNSNIFTLVTTILHSIMYILNVYVQITTMMISEFTLGTIIHKFIVYRFMWRFQTL